MFQCDDGSNVTSDDDSSKRSVRFIDANNKIDTENSTGDRDICDGQAQSDQHEDDTDSTTTDVMPLKKQSILFHNALRPNSAVRQLFPASTSNPATNSATNTTTVTTTAPLTHESLRAFDEAKRLHLHATIVHSDSETDTIRRTLERNALRRSLIKYEPK